MKKSEVVLGRVYWINHMGSKTRVRLVEETHTGNAWSKRVVTRYGCIKLSTGNKIMVKSAAKFLSEETE